MTIGLVATIANLLAAIGVLASLFYLAQQIRQWWRSVGRVGFNADFVAMVDDFLEDRPMIACFKDIDAFDRPRRRPGRAARPAAELAGASGA